MLVTFFDAGTGIRTVGEMGSSTTSTIFLERDMTLVGGSVTTGHVTCGVTIPACPGDNIDLGISILGRAGYVVHLVY